MPDNIKGSAIYSQATASYNKASQGVNRISQLMNNEPKDIVSVGQKTSIVDNVDKIGAKNDNAITASAVLRKVMT